MNTDDSPEKERTVSGMTNTGMQEIQITHRINTNIAEPQPKQTLNVTTDDELATLKHQDILETKLILK
jgi:hypothetical protein